MEALNDEELACVAGGAYVQLIQPPISMDRLLFALYGYLEPGAEPPVP